MATATIPLPLRMVRDDSNLVAGLVRSRTVPRIVGYPLKYWLFPLVLKRVTSTLSGETLGLLTREQATSLYPCVEQFHRAVCDVLDGCERRPWLVRVLMRRWITEVSSGAERLEDIVESLAWGSDQDLRKIIDSAVSEIESPLLVPQVEMFD